MKAGWLLALVALTIGYAGRAAAQDVFLANPDALSGVRAVPGGQFSLRPADSNVISTSPLFLEDPGARPRGVASSQTVGGVAATSTGPGQLSVGFDYLRPFWSFRDFTLAIPPAYGQFFPVLTDVGHTDSQFAFVPTVRYNFHVADLGLDVGAAGTFLSVSGRLHRDVATTGLVAGDLAASYDLTLVSVIPVQVARRFDPAELFGEKDHDAPAGTLIDLSIGSRYVSLDQGYTSTVHAAGLGGVNLATRTTSQSFQGLGITAAMGWQVPAGEDWLTFIGSRGSVLVGNNNRTSNATVVVAGLPGYADSISESKTTLLPVFELEAGFEWGTELGSRLARGEPPPVLSVRLAGIGQYWGGMGPLSAGSSQGFKTSDLFLAGVSVTVGLRH